MAKRGHLLLYNLGWLVLGGGLASPGRGLLGLTSELSAALRAGCPSAGDARVTPQESGTPAGVAQVNRTAAAGLACLCCPRFREEGYALSVVF